MAHDSPWPPQWLRGVLELCVLAVVGRAETYGYVVGQRLESAGLGPIKGGTLYPILLRLEADGLLSSAWRGGEAGPSRKFYALTEFGRSELDRRREAWQSFVGITAGLLGPTSGEGSR